MRDDEFCEYCGDDVSSGSSHYHCPYCNERCSMMGHIECIEAAAAAEAEAAEDEETN